MRAELEASKGTVYSAIRGGKTPEVDTPAHPRLEQLSRRPKMNAPATYLPRRGNGGPGGATAKRSKIGGDGCPFGRVFRFSGTRPREEIHHAVCVSPLLGDSEFCLR